MQLQSGFNEYESGIETIHASLRADAMTANLEIQSIEGRLRLLARRMLSQYPSVGRWDETDDVLQEALVRLDRALIQVSPGSDLHIMRLGALQIRRVLLDLARRYSSSHHFASNHESREVEELMGTDRLSSDGSLTIEDWSEFHRQADQLPPPLREVVDLLWYMGLSQREVADTLEVTERTVQRRWREARLALHQRVCCQDQDRK
jgi:RNA polymerase sigma-70 factor (ECF subfamily)